MDKTKAAKVLSAAAVANLTIAGLAASPAGASAHSRASATETPSVAADMPSAGKAHPGLMLIPAREAHSGKLSPQLRRAIAKAASQARTASAKPRGFVPGATSGNRVNTATGCNNHVCIGVYGHGLFVSSVKESFIQWGGCHIGSIYYGPYSSFNSTCRYEKQQNIYPFFYSFSNSEYICAQFSGVPGTACEKVHR